MPDSRIRLLQGDITTIAVDAIVNAANASLMGGGGVDGAIHRRGGPEILEVCKEIVARQGRLPTGEAVITTAGRLPARYVIHTVGPVWSNSGPEEKDRLLASCYRNSLQLAKDQGLRTIAFPNISTGVYGYPKDRAARVVVQAVEDFLATDDQMTEVLFVCFDAENTHLYEGLIGESR